MRTINAYLPCICHEYTACKGETPTELFTNYDKHGVAHENFFCKFLNANASGMLTALNKLTAQGCSRPDCHFLNANASGKLTVLNKLTSQ